MLKNLNKIGFGNTAEIFQLDNERILKLFKTGYVKENVIREYQNHCIVCKKRNDVPKVYDIVEENGRFGYIMEHVQGVSLAALLMNAQEFEKAMELFARIHKTWSVEASSDMISYKDWMKAVIGDRENTSELLEKINQLPAGTILCHGDFHPYNIIVTEENRPIVIDFANICRGPKEYDIARTYFLLEEAGAKQIAEIYLKKMQISFNGIQEYYEVIKQLRIYERNEKEEN